MSTKEEKEFLFKEVWSDMWLPSDTRRVQKDLLASIKVEPPEDINVWAEKNFDLSYDPTSFFKDKIKLYPWQKKVLDCFQQESTRHIVLMGPSRTSKTTILGICMAWQARYLHLPAGMALENVDKATSYIKNILLPIMAHIDYFKEYLTPNEIKRRFKLGCMVLPTCSFRVFGGGSPATSWTIGAIFCDEADRMTTQTSENELSVIESLMIRTETYPNRKIFICSTPGEQNRIGKYYTDGSQGHWHLKCPTCGHMWRSDIIGYVEPTTKKKCGLQWDKSDDGEVIAESLKFHCPQCEGIFDESYSVKMNEHGDFVHKFPNRPIKSFHIGCLGLPYLSKGEWLNIAMMLDLSGKKATRTQRQKWSIEYLGKPFVDKSVKEDDRHQIIKQKIQSPPPNFNPCVVFAGIDTQRDDEQGKKYWKMCTIAVERSGNSYQLEYRRFDDILVMEKHIKEKEFYGKKISLALMDVAGVSNISKNEDMMPLINRNYPLIIGYVGTGTNNSIGADGWVRQSDNPKIFHFRDTKWQSNALDSIFLDDVEKLFFSPTNPPEFLEEIVSMKPPKNDENADFYKWKKLDGSARNEFFDCIKMALICKELVAQSSFIAPHATIWAPMYRWARDGIPEYIQKRIKESMTRKNIDPK